MSFTPFLRKSVDIGFFANKSKGKTLTLAFFGFIYWLRGYQIFSNFPLNYPYTPIQSLEDLRMIKDCRQDKPKILLGSDFERWFNSRKSTSKLNLDIGTVTMDLGKCNCSLFYDSKRPAIIDISLRDTTDYFCEIVPIMPYRPQTESDDLNKILVEYWRLNFEMCWIQINVFDPNLCHIGTMYLRNLQMIGKLYDTMGFTQEIIA